MSIIITTNRLHLRQFKLTDTQFIIELLNSPDWLAYIGNRHISTTQQAQIYLNGLIKSYTQNGFGFWLVELKTDQTPIGMCGIIKRNGLQNPDIGFAFLPAFTNQGYAYEAANASILFAYNTLQLPHICAITLSENKKSIKLLEKIGLRFSHNITLPDDTEELMLFKNTPLH